MCGISGIVSFERSELSLLKVTEAMNQTLRHRGPDDEGFVLIENKNCLTIGSRDTPENAWNSSFPYAPKFRPEDLINKTPQIVLGHRRLSIIDLSPAGHQPMCDSDGRYWIVFNGAIYNFEELKVDLIKLGHTFYSHTDTEVLLHAYMEWGAECVQKFIGMWAFLIYDNYENKIFASRDRLGIKPFYYSYSNKYFSFASEIKALTTLPFIQKKVNEIAIYDYLVLSKCEFEEEGMFKNIFELSPAHNFEIDLRNGNLKKWKYYNPKFNSRWEKYDERKNKEYVSELQDLIQDSIRLHLRTDAKVGTCLSGGIDSSIITRLVSNAIPDLPVFTVTSIGDAEDESKWAKLLVDKFTLDWHTTNPQPSDLLQNFEKLMYCQDMPCMSANTYTHFELMRLVNEQGVKVTIDGQGADELFGGYPYYYPSFLLNALYNGSFGTVFNSLKEQGNDFAQKKMACTLPFKMVSSKISGNLIRSRAFRIRHSEFSFIKAEFWNAYSERIALLQNKIHSNFNGTLFHDYHGGTLKNMLRVGDRNSMHFGIETRVPFSDDFRLEEFAFKVPATYKVKNNFSKALLRDVAKLWIPKEICIRKDKKGFTIPEKRWLLEIGEKVFPYFDNSVSSYINVDLLKKEWMVALQNSHSTSRIWRLLCFAVWTKAWKQ